MSRTIRTSKLNSLDFVDPLGQPNAMEEFIGDVTLETSREVRHQIFSERLHRQHVPISASFAALDLNAALLHDESEYGEKKKETEAMTTGKIRSSVVPKLPSFGSRERKNPSILTASTTFHSAVLSSHYSSIDSAASEVSDRPLVFSLGFDYFDKEVPELVDISMEITAQLNLVLPEQNKYLYNFYKAILELYYDNNKYHNHTHGFSVFHVAALFFTCVPDFSAELGSDYSLGLLVACLGHDVGHPGYSNHAEIVSKTDLAKEMNNKAVLEAYHTATVINTLGRAECDVFKHMVKFDKLRLKQFIVKLIMSTDMQKNRRHIDELKDTKDLNYVFYGESVLSNDDLQKKNRIQRFCNAFIHCCDMSAQVGELRVAVKWGERVSQEFRDEARFLQDRNETVPERLLGYIEKNDLNFYHGQIGFIKFCVKPLWDELSRLFPETAILQFSLKDNLRFYESTKEEDAELNVEKYMKRNSMRENVLDELYSSLQSKEIKKKKRSAKSRRSNHKTGRSRRKGKSRSHHKVKRKAGSV